MVHECSVESCSNLAVSRGWCPKHYMRWIRHGSPEKTSRRNNEDAFDFLKEALKTSTDDCIIWPFKTYLGYGAIRLNGKLLRAHRHICECAHGLPLQKKIDAAHKCGVRKCMNPRHIRWATRSENEMDKVDHGLSNRGVRQWKHKLNEAQVLAIKVDYAKGKSKQALYAEYAVAPRTIRDILNGVTWNWLR